MAVEDFFSAELGIPKNLGDELRYNCPFCGDNNSYKLYLNISGGDKDSLWHCFKCGAKGNPPSFVMQLYGVSFKDAIEELKAYDYDPDRTWASPQSLGLTDSEYLLLALKDKLKPKEKEEPTYVPPPLPNGYKRLVDNLHSLEAYPFLLYAHRRGFSMQDIITHNIGYVTYSEVLLPSGKTLLLRDHLVFLSHDDNGQYIYWNTRAIGDSFVKSINAPSAENEYSKSTVVFNLNLAKKTDKIVINEGVPDAITVGTSGVATFGKEVTDAQINIILKGLTNEQHIYILLDNDAKQQIKKLATKLYERHKNTFIVINRKGDDANDMGREKTWELINNSSVRADSQGILTLMLSI